MSQGPIEVTKQINLGNIITLIILLCSGVMAFAVAQTQLSTLASASVDHSKRIRELELNNSHNMAEINQRLKNIEQSLSVSRLPR